VQPERRDFDADGIRIHAAVWRNTSSQEPPIVLLHGIWDTWRIFQETGSLLSARRSVYALDLRGHGDSDKPEAAYTYEDYAADVRSVVSQISSERVDLLGYSMGTAICVFVALRNPRIRKIVLEDPPLHPRAIARAAAASWLEVKKLPLADVIHAMQRTYPSRSRLLVEENARTLLRTSDAALESIRDGTLDVDWPASLPELTVPVLILRADPSAGGLLDDEQCARLSRLTKDARIVEFPGCGHSIHGQEPTAVAGAVEDFLG
jgi:pimeloyl-ACP methyl ester carboxylesterase